MNRTVAGSRTHVAGPMQTEPFDVVPCAQNDRPEMKPKGLWWEVDGDWRRWCADEGYGHSEGHLYEVDLGSSRILRLTTIRQIDAFHAKWSEPLVEDFRLIRWDWVAQEWDGIEIAPYQWGRRLDGEAHRWYYSWDCASGVVWSPQAVTLTYLEPYVLTARDCPWPVYP